MRGVLTVIVVLFAVLIFPAVVLASIGVGVGTGKIDIQEKIKSGSIYTLPSVVVFNTGTQQAQYKMSVTFNEVQPQQKPDPAWFSFEPKQFTLNPGESQAVEVSLHPPVVTPPGEYFAYLEANPDQTVNQGGTAVGVAAATKLSFSVEQSNFLLGLLYRIIALYKKFAPWSYVLTALAIITPVYIFARRRLHLSIQLTKTQPKGKALSKPKTKPPAKSKAKKKSPAKTKSKPKSKPKSKSKK